MEAEIEKIEQEITLQLQRIDGNLTDCFTTVTRSIIPSLKQFSEHSEDILDSLSWLTTLFERSGNVDFNTLADGEAKQSEASATANATASATTNATTNATATATAAVRAPDQDSSLQDPPTVSHLQSLMLPDSSDDEDYLTVTGQQPPAAEPSTSQLARSNKRKVSLLLQQEYASSSSYASSPLRRG
ncbi:hypothetical protein TBLA_0H02760 [Henningerozyma blattae CBS 6284]|uniref:DASH complex subunit ASK1 n=1 Tax=Henningerozyma blattae (strain ATCC 34711 / CBS 6284 / DSM 70876 / NBRC 10599 / NRRL Y-10934 / UCD 77-7) TaxID=1071380 RepID=I2H858_HENB6|nr:hypothetical protein TBLA_0H02760 [Tetrapisispora blattae CBS 6284]CCH62560.1 hypothetical protein TBLA_0H02760 [Tetrapisispora blattae CBS 6284]